MFSFASRLFLPLQALLLTSLVLSSCSEKAKLFEPTIVYFPQQRHIKCLPHTFADLSYEEMRTDWGKELKIGDVFARDLDLYRAITSYKRALILIPCYENERRFQIQYDIVLAYYLGGKYQDAIDIFEDGNLSTVPEAFPGFRSLLIVLYDAYLKVENEDKACAILTLIEKYDPEEAQNLKLSTAIIDGDIAEVESQAVENPNGPDLLTWLCRYEQKAKSVEKAQFLNAVLPGAGYYYVEQKQTAFTAFLVNAVFIAATAQLINKGYVPAAIITGSLEMGWYLGGINGGGLAAKAYNEALYADYSKEAMIQHRLFPVLMFETAF